MKSQQCVLDQCFNVRLQASPSYKSLQTSVVFETTRILPQLRRCRDSHRIIDLGNYYQHPFDIAIHRCQESQDVLQSFRNAILYLCQDDLRRLPGGELPLKCLDNGTQYGLSVG